MEYQTIKGEKVPLLGLGIWRLSGEECTKAVERALARATVYGPPLRTSHDV